ncbi:DUF4158 domain-containing protein [Enterobacter hormaechei]|uniref:DUF4158 domain-containing protein n=1 Tax=Enterobacter hormaechei TaxID=158836 RepID=UPI00388EF3AE
MAFEERVQILSEAEQDELYGPPAFTSADQRFFFSLNDKELAIAKSLRHRGQRYMLVVLLGYFKAKPVVLNPGFHQIKQDLKYVYQTVLPGPAVDPLISRQKRTNGFTTCFPALQLPALECQRPWSGVERLLIPASQSPDSA